MIKYLPEVHCYECKYWGCDRYTGIGNKCHRYPEVVDRQEFDGCGEWEERTSEDREENSGTNSNRPNAIPNIAFDYWQCANCGHLNRFSEGWSCKGCKAGMPSNQRDMIVTIGDRKYKVYYGKGPVGWNL